MMIAAHPAHPSHQAYFLEGVAPSTPQNVKHTAHTHPHPSHQANFLEGEFSMSRKT
jgi:hypothetical protein